ncbi:MAG: hypothetical protein QXD59_02110 [Candidatus Caldarchaeum sp.]
MLLQSLTLATFIVGMLISSLSDQAQEVLCRNGEVFLRKVTGEIIQLTNDGKKKYEVLLSPDARWVIYRGEPKQDRAMLRLDITMIDVNDSGTKRTIHFHTALRSVTKLKWLNDRYFALIGETNSKNSYYAIFDVKVREVITELVGYGFSLSTDRLALVYRPFVPRGAPSEFASHYIEIFDLRDQQPARRHEGRKYARLLYPEHDPDNAFTNLDDRHFVRSNLAWSSDSRSIAFVEQHRRTYWLTILELQQVRHGVQVSNIKSFQLAKAEELQLGDETQVIWKAPDTLVVTGVEWVWDQSMNQYREGPQVEWQIDLTKGVVSKQETTQR